MSFSCALSVRWFVGCLVLVLGLWLGASGSAMAKAPRPDWSFGPTPKWVEPIAGPQDPAFATDHAVEGLGYEVIETQRRIVDGKHWTFVRVVVRILSAAGAEHAGQQTFGFSPPNERLVLHGIELRRGDEVSSRLERGEVQLLQREANLENLVYDNRRTAFVLVPDLRVGDVLESSWSVVSESPVMEGHVGLGVATQRSFAVAVSSDRVLVDHPLKMRSFADAPRPTEARVGGLYEYTLRGDSLLPTPDVPDLPVEEQLRGWVQFTDFESWTEVAQWGLRTFESVAIASPSVHDVLRELQLGEATRDEQVLAVLHWVQQEIRYFSLPFADSTHRPELPATVLERRYGDCKDVALLTVVMLRQLGIDAQVALVDADEGRFLPEMLPSASAFDHAVVVTFPHGEPVWLDPTLTHQAGSLEHVAAKGLHWALPLAHDVTQLVRVLEPTRTGPDVVFEAEYDATSYDAPASLSLSARYTGGWAESFRYVHETRESDALRAFFEESIEPNLREAHPEAKATGEVEYVDDRDANRIELRRTYDIPGFWTIEDGRRITNLTPFSLFGVATDPKPDRAHPLALPFPDHRRHVARLDLPEDFELDVDRVVIDGPLFFSRSATSNGDHVVVDWSIATERHRVEVDELTEYSAALDQVNESFGFWLYSDVPATTEPGAFNWTVFSLGAMWALLLVGIAVWVIKRAPYIRRDHLRYDPSLVGLSGWLVLVGFGLISSFIGVLVDGYQLLPSYEAATWAALTTPDAPGYDPIWAPVLLFELLGNLGLLVLTALGIYTYFKKHRSFPIVFIALHVVAALLPTIDEALTASIPEVDPTAPGEVVVRWVRGILWVGYALRSVRVRSTFLPPPQDYVAPDAPWSFRPR